MPEATVDASLLIATSWQALGRVRSGERETTTCNCAVVIVFAAFFIEANLDHISRKLGKRRRMKAFLNNATHPGLKDKLGWFYNYHLARRQVARADKRFKRNLGPKLERNFPGFTSIWGFRNKLSHGSVDLALANPQAAEHLRKQAKAIVEALYDTLEEAGTPVRRAIWYKTAIATRR